MATPLPNADHALKCKYEGAYLTTLWVNIFYVIYAGTTPTDADLATAATSMRAAWLATLGASTCNTVTLSKTSIQDVSRNPGAYGENTTTAAGTAGATGFPANVSVCVSKKVARRYRGGHPRLYLPGVPSTYSADGRSIVGGSLTALNANVAAWRTQINAITTASTGALTLANVGYYYTPVPHQPPVLRPSPIVEAVVSCSVNSRLDSQRRRLG